MDDYYAILGVERTATPEEIEKEIKQELRTWTKRTNSPELPRRQEAERRVQQLSEARKLLLDPEQRGAYDRRLAAEPVASQANTDKAAGTGWLEEALRHQAANDYLSAAYAARMARDAAPDDPVAWRTLAWANVQLRNTNDAVFEAGRAVMLAPGDATYHYDLGEIHFVRRSWKEAMESYQRALQLDPGLEAAGIGIAGVLQSTGRYPESLSMMEQLYQRSQNKDWMGDQLGLALLLAAEALPRVQLPGSYAVTSPEEIMSMQQYVDRARQVSRQSDLMTTAQSIERHLTWCVSRHWQPRPWMTNGCLIVIVLGLLLFIGIGFLGALAASDPASAFGALVFGVIVFGPIAAIVYFTGYIPGWKLNQTAYPRPAVLTGAWRP
jgi:tetratricopeptide (TPR) repeat protein